VPLVIKNADEITYSRFKAKAAEKGLRIGEAITEAMKIWLKQAQSADIDQIMEDRNELAFRRIFPGLLKQYEGKWGIISSSDLVGVYQTRQECYDTIREQGLSEVPNLVFPIQKITPRHVVLTPYRRIVNAP